MLDTSPDGSHYFGTDGNTDMDLQWMSEELESYCFYILNPRLFLYSRVASEAMLEELSFKLGLCDDDDDDNEQGR